MASTRIFVESYLKNGPMGASPLYFPNTVGNAPTGQITILLGCTGVNSTVSGYSPLAYGYDILRVGKADALIVGACEELTHDIEAAHVHKMVVETPGTSLMASPPLLAEGGAAILVERFSDALARKVVPLAEVVSYGLVLSLPEVSQSIDEVDFIEEKAIFAAMAQAIGKARISLDSVAGIVSLTHENATIMQTEKNAVAKLFKNHSYPSILYPQNVLGETFGASDCFNVITACLVLNDNYFKEFSQPEKFILSNSFHIGGNVFSFLLKACFTNGKNGSL